LDPPSFSLRDHRPFEYANYAEERDTFIFLIPLVASFNGWGMASVGVEEKDVKRWNIGLSLLLTILS